MLLLELVEVAFLVVDESFEELLGRGVGISGAFERCVVVGLTPSSSMAITLAPTVRSASSGLESVYCRRLTATLERLAE